MTQPTNIDFIPSKLPEDRHHQRALRPKDAATLILLRKHKGQYQVLMGKRHADMAFMPNRYVFPGGRVSFSDTRIIPGTPLRPDVEDKLRQHTRRTNVQSLALAAIRETFEETGLLVGQKIPSGKKVQSRSPEWQGFYHYGVEPTLDQLEFVARAITPPMRSRRFDARFFTASADLVQGNLHDLSEESNELLDLKWLTFDEAQSLKLSDITYAVLQLIDDRLNKRDKDNRPVFVRYTKNKMMASRI